MRTLLTVILASAAVALLGAQTTQRRPASATEAMYQAAADRAQLKLDHVVENSKRPQPNPAPTIFTEIEMNAYVSSSSGRVKLPAGVHNLAFIAASGMLTANADVDFDQVTAGRRSSNPLLSLFSGVHRVTGIAHGEGRGGVAQIHIDSMALDGVEVPRMALQFFIERYIRPKYPQAGLDSRWQMPYRIDSATLGDHTLTLVQK